MSKETKKNRTSSNLKADAGPSDPGLRSVVCGLQSPVCGLRSPVTGHWSVVCSLWSVVFNLAYGLFGLFYLPVFCMKMKQAEDPRRLLRERLGWIAPETLRKISGRRTVWVHAVSVGEVMALREFLKGFLERFPELHGVLSTVTPTGQKIARELESPRLSVVYFPFDFSFSCRKFFEQLKPDCLLLAETEIWPNLLLEAGRAGVRVGILNARLSRKSARRYRRFLKLFAPLFQRIDFIFSQTGQDALRFESLGIERSRIEVLGNMKLDQMPSAGMDPALSAKEKAKWGYGPEDRIWVAGSTHPGEEEMVFEVLRDLRAEFPGLKMILAPRHIERSSRILELAKKWGVEAELSEPFQPGRRREVLILNQLGVLKDIYSFADVVFVGGSLVSKGGQNPVEPAVFRKGILHGPHVFNFETLYQWLDLQGGSRAVNDRPALHNAVVKLLRDPAERSLFGDKAFGAVLEMRGATARHLDRVQHFLPGKPQERINDGAFDTKLFPQVGGRL